MKANKSKSISELLERCLACCQDERAGLTDAEAEQIERLITLIEKYEIKSVEHIEAALYLDLIA